MRTSDKKPKSEARRTAQTRPPPTPSISPLPGPGLGDLGRLGSYRLIPPTVTSQAPLLPPSSSRSPIRPLPLLRVYGEQERNGFSDQRLPQLASLLSPLSEPLSQTIHKTSSPTVLQPPYPESVIPHGSARDAPQPDPDEYVI